MQVQSVDPRKRIFKSGPRFPLISDGTGMSRLPRFPLLASRFYSFSLALVTLLALPLFPAPARALSALFSATDRSRTIFPSDIFTAPDPEMITGLRVALPDRAPKGDDHLRAGPRTERVGRLRLRAADRHPL